jgi:hypothetical protein
MAKGEEAFMMTFLFIAVLTMVGFLIFHRPRGCCQSKASLLIESEALATQPSAGIVFRFVEPAMPSL